MVSGVSLRLARPWDAADIQAIYAPIVRETVISFEMDAPTIEHMAQRIRDTLPTHPWLVAEQDGQLLGYAYASPHRPRAAYGWSVDVSIYVAECARRHGVGRQLYEALFQILRQQGFVMAYGGIALPNDASVGLHEHMGFVCVGTYSNVGYKNGCWCDVGWWELQLQPPPAAAAKPLPLSAVDTSAVIAKRLP